MKKEDTFYEQQIEEHERIPKHDLKIVLIGYCNAKVGKEPTYTVAVGKHSQHEKINDNGQRLIGFAIENSMMVRITQLNKKNSDFARREHEQSN